jgi:uncharacterized protein
MVPDWLQKLLILQDRDARLAGLEKQAAAAPQEIASVEAAITKRRQAIEAAKGRVRDWELRRKALEADIAAAEQQGARYKTQQAQVKKNEEYKALTHEIELVEGRISELEEAEIQVLYDLDAEREKAKATEKELELEIRSDEERIGRIKERIGQMLAEAAEARGSVAEARAAVPEASLKVYDRIAKFVALPVAAPLRESKCGGCHLKVSSGVESETRRSDKIVACEHCGRILYWDS